TWFGCVSYRCHCSSPPVLRVYVKPACPGMPLPRGAQPGEQRFGTGSTARAELADESRRSWISSVSHPPTVVDTRPTSEDLPCGYPIRFTVRRLRPQVGDGVAMATLSALEGCGFRGKGTDWAGTLRELINHACARLETICPFVNGRPA